MANLPYHNEETEKIAAEREAELLDGSYPSVDLSELENDSAKVEADGEAE